MFSSAWGLWIEYTVRMSVCACAWVWVYAVLHGSCVYAALMSGWCSSKGVGWTWENVQQLVRRPTPPPASHTHTHTHTGCFQSSSSTVFQQTNQLYLISRCSANLAYRCTKGWPLLSQRALLNRPLPQMVPCCKPAPLPHTHTHTHTHTRHLLLIGARFSFRTHFGLKIHFRLYYWGSLNSALLFCISRQYCALFRWFSQSSDLICDIHIQICN